MKENYDPEECKIDQIIYRLRKAMKAKEEVEE